MCSEGDGGLDSRRTSTVDTLPGSIPDLFEILTSEPDDQRRWTTFTYSAHFDLLGFSNEELDHLKERELTKTQCTPCVYSSSPLIIMNVWSKERRSDTASATRVTTVASTST